MRTRITRERETELERQALCDANGRPALADLRMMDLVADEQATLDLREACIIAHNTEWSLTLSGYRPHIASELAEQAAKDAIVEIRRERRVDADRATLTLRNDRSCRVDDAGTVRPASREAHKANTAYVTRGPDAFTLAERSALRANEQGPAIVAQWAACASQSAVGTAERGKATNQDLLALAHAATTKTDALRLAALWRTCATKQASQLRADLLAALGRGLDRKGRQRLRQAFDKATS